MIADPSSPVRISSESRLAVSTVHDRCRRRLTPPPPEGDRFEGTWQHHQVPAIVARGAGHDHAVDSQLARRACNLQRGGVGPPRRPGSSQGSEAGAQGPTRGWVSQVKHPQVDIQGADPTRVILGRHLSVGGVSPFGPHRLPIERCVQRPWVAGTMVAGGVRRRLRGWQTAGHPQRGLTPGSSAKAADRRQRGSRQVGSPAA
jgi:hypothetical protein